MSGLQRICDVDALTVDAITEVPIGRGRTVAVYARRNGTVLVFSPICPHRGAPLAQGRVLCAVTAVQPGSIEVDTETRVLACPWHNWEYELDTGTALVDPSRRLKVYPSIVADGAVHISREATA